jgi:hypothetical protein
MCLALAKDSGGQWMNENGRVRPVKHRKIGAALGLAEQTVANKILEASRQGLLVKDPTTGNRGTGAAYQATFPKPTGQWADGPVSLRAMLAGTVKVPAIEEPSDPQIEEPFTQAEHLKVPRIGEAQRARY